MFRYSIFLILIGFCVALVIFEIIDFNFLNKPKYDPGIQFDPYLGWVPVPNLHVGDITTNSLGFRSDEIDQKMDQIIVSGDSVAFGLYVKNNETAAYYLNEELKPFNYQVQNLGVRGYGPDQYYLYLKKNIDKFKKLEYVFVIICTSNDYENVVNDVQYGKRKPLFVLRGNEPVLSNVPINKFDLRNVLSGSKLIAVLSRNEKISGFFDYLAGHTTLDDAQGRRLMAVLFDKINRLVTEHHARLIFVLSPSKKDLFKETRKFGFFKELLPQYSYVNLLNDLKGRKKDADLIYHDGKHYSPLGNKLLADSILGFLKSNDPQLNLAVPLK